MPVPYTARNNNILSHITDISGCFSRTYVAIMVMDSHTYFVIYSCVICKEAEYGFI